GDRTPARGVLRRPRARGRVLRMRRGRGPERHADPLRRGQRRQPLLRHAPRGGLRDGHLRRRPAPGRRGLAGAAAAAHRRPAVGERLLRALLLPRAAPGPCREKGSGPRRAEEGDDSTARGPRRRRARGAQLRPHLPRARVDGRALPAARPAEHVQRRGGGDLAAEAVGMRTATTTATTMTATTTTAVTLTNGGTS